MKGINFGFISSQGLNTTTDLEGKIDRMVYDSNSNNKKTELYSILNNFELVLTKYDGIQIFVNMYGLTEEERKIVGGGREGKIYKVIFIKKRTKFI